MTEPMKQQAFLTKLAKALARDKPLTQAPVRDEVGPPAFWKERKFETHESLEMFKRNLENVGGRVFIAETPNEARQQLQIWLQEVNAQSLIMWDHPELHKIIQPDSLEMEVTLWSSEKEGSELVKIAERADVGLTWADYAIGYTGSLALFSGANQGRSVSLLPPTHIAVCKKSNLVPTMSVVIRKLVEKLAPGELPGSVTFITGPSRTSDIEMDLSIGVHGPYRVWTIVIED